jgi:hypothetical protein
MCERCKGLEREVAALEDRVRGLQDGCRRILAMVVDPGKGFHLKDHTPCADTTLVDQDQRRL